MPWVTPEDVATWAEASVSDHAGLGLVVEAAAAWVESKRTDLPWENVDLPEGDPLKFVVPAQIRQGTCLLAWRWYQRKGSALGTVTGYEGQVGQILRFDPDIADMLGIGRGGRFLFGAARPTPPVVTT